MPTLSPSHPAPSRTAGPRRLPAWAARVLPLALAVLLVAAVPQAPAVASEGSVSRYLDAIRDDPVRLRSFLYEMPKGADLHNHLSGAVPTETLLRFAIEDGLCVDVATLVASPPPCAAGQRPAQDTVTDATFRGEVLQAWSMEGFTAGPESGHDHFFDTFGKFGAATDGHRAEMLAEVASIAAAQNEFYLETMTTRQGTATAELATRVGFDPDFGVMLARLEEGGGLERLVAAVKAETDADVAEYRSVLRCDSPAPARACLLPVRFQHQVLRAQPPEVVFTQLALGFELMAQDDRYVGVNMVQPEDSPVALRDYELHMRMVGFLRDRYSGDRVTLHAGELSPALAPAADLRFHIRDAVLVAGAERIGHGVDIAGEDDAPDLLGTMARRHVLVEIALTSNCQILTVCGLEHPFTLYRRHGVPVALVTDDEGVERVDLTHEYQQAATTFGLSYGDLKTLARASLDHGFLQGESLWRGPDRFRPADACAQDRLGEPDPSRRCRRLLASSPRAAAEWTQEAAFAGFEHRYGG